MPMVKFITTGDLLTGVKNAPMGTLMNTLYETWNKDPVYGEKRAYRKIGLAKLHFLDKKKRDPSASLSRKRARDSGSPPGGGDRTKWSGRDPSRSAYATLSWGRGSPADRRGGPCRDG
jgi:hypothetical protein